MRARLKIKEGVCLSLEVRRRVEEEQHTRTKAEEDARLVEEASLKDEEEDEDLRLKAEEGDRLADEARPKAEEEEQAQLRADKEARLSKEARQKS